MYLHLQRLINEIEADEPDPAAANALQEGLGGQFGEMRTMMQYLFQAMNFRGPAGKPYRDLIQGVGTEEISHVELIGTTIARLMDGSPRYNGKKTDPLDKAGAGGATPMESALSVGNIHHYLVGAQGALPVDSVGNPWSGSYVYNSGNLVLDLLYNLMLESTGRLQKCRIYEMTDNKTARSTIAYLIVRDQAHENAYAKALESLGVDWNKTLPIPKTNAEAFPESRRGCRASSTASASTTSPRPARSTRACRPRATAPCWWPTSRCRRACRRRSPSSAWRSSRRASTRTCSRCCRRPPRWRWPR
jgi:Mn-containing catalase